MRCHRCQGLMVTSRFSDYYVICYEWKCINCGAIVFPPAIDALATEVPKNGKNGLQARPYTHAKTNNGK